MTEGQQQIDFGQFMGGFSPQASATQTAPAPAAAEPAPPAPTAAPAAAPAPTTAAPIPSAQPTSVPAFDPAAWLREQTGGQYDSFQAFQADAERARLELQQQLDAQKAVNPYATPLVAKLNELSANGASDIEIRNFLHFQNMDVASMPEQELVEELVKAKHPYLKPHQVVEHIKSPVGLGLGISDYGEGELSPQSQTALAIKAEEARQFFAQQKVAAENPVSIQQKQAAQLAEQQNREAWAAQANAFAAEVKSKQLSHKTTDGDFSLDYQFSPEARQRAAQLLAESMAGKGLTQPELESAKGLYEMYATMHDVATGRYAQTIVDDITASLREFYAKKYAGPMPERNPGIPAAAVQQPSTGFNPANFGVKQ